MSTTAQAVTDVQALAAELETTKTALAAEMTARTLATAELETIKATPEYAQYQERIAAEARIAENLPKAQAARKADGSNPEGLTIQIVGEVKPVSFCKDKALRLIASGVASFVGVVK